MVDPARYQFVTKKLVDVWEGLIRRAIEVKQPYQNRCEQIDYFYSGRADFMWDAPYQNRFMGGAAQVIAPKFKITINKAFEYVAVMKPRLFWQMATRKVVPHRTLKLDPFQLFGIQPPEEGQMDEAQMELAQIAMEMARGQALEDEKTAQRAKVVEHILNYFPAEQPGGLAQHINDCLEDSLLYGAAFMKTEPYQFPESDKTLVKSIRVDVRDVLVDPDCRDPSWLKAKWVAIRHRWTVTDTERYFDLPAGSLKGYATAMTAGAMWSRGAGTPPTMQRDLQANMIEWYEIYSRAGCGNQLVGKQEIAPEFDEAIDGNAAYICIAKNVPFPLNLPAGTLMAGVFTEEQEAGLVPAGAPVEWVTQQLRWPTEYWRDDKWPITKLAYYPHSSTNLWPEPPIAPGIGELTAINILVTSYVEMVFDNRQQLCAVLKGHVDNFQDVQNSSKNPFFFEVDPKFATGTARAVNEVIQFLNRPEVNKDVMRGIDFLLAMFEQRTGMTRRMYGEQGGATPRSAAESTAMEENANLRPEYMRKCVAEWQSAVADLEVFCAWSHVQAKDMEKQLGPLGMAAYELLIERADPEEILRGLDCYVEASAIARPNRERDANILDRLQQTLIPVLSGYAMQYNDPAPLNGLLDAVGVASGIDVERFKLPEKKPDDEAQAVQQQMQQMQVERQQAETAKIQAETERILSDIQASNKAEERMLLDGQQIEENRMLELQKLEDDRMREDIRMENELSRAALDQQEKINRIEQQRQRFDLEQTIRESRARQEQDIRSQEAKQKLLSDMLKMAQSQQAQNQTLQMDQEKLQDDARHRNLVTFSKMMMNANRGGQK